MLDPEEIKNAGIGIITLIVIVYMIVEIIKVVFR